MHAPPPLLLRDDPELARAIAADAHSARALLETLAFQSRKGHPSTDHLDALAAEHALAPSVIASVALEAGVRCHLGALAAATLPHEGTPPALLPYLRERSANPWEEHPQAAYIEVDWPAALFELGRACLDGAFEIDPHIPGARTLAWYSAQSDATETTAAHLVGDAPRNDVFDPIAANGAFLAQAMPRFVDLDVLLRAHRLDRLTRDKPSRDG